MCVCVGGGGGGGWGGLVGGWSVQYNGLNNVGKVIKHKNCVHSNPVFYEE